MHTIKTLVSNLSWFERLLLLSPVADLLIGIAHHHDIEALTYSAIIYRATLITVIFILYLKIDKKDEKLKWLLALCLVFVMANIVFINIFVDTSHILSNINASLRFWYFPIITICLIDLIRSKVVSINVSVIYYLAIAYSILLILPTMLGIHVSSYPEWTGKFGSAGLFYEGNEVGLILGLSFFGLLHYLTKTKRKIIGVISLMVILGASILNGTKAPIIAFLFAALTYLCYLLLFRSRLSSVVKSSILIACSVVVFITGFLYFNNLYQNPYYQEKDLINSLLFSGRLDYAKLRLESFGDGSLAEQVMGTSQYAKSGEFVKHAEIDPVDMLYSFGALGLSIYAVVVCIFLMPIFKRLSGSDEIVFYRVGILIALIGSAVMGHILSSPSVVIIPIIYILLSYSIAEREPND